MVPATESEIPRLQRQGRARGNRQLTLAPPGTAEEHLFSVLHHPAAVLRPGSPIFGGVGTPREGRFLGWLLIGMRGQDFINETLLRASQDIALSSSRNRALTDSLTGLGNRRAFMDRLDQSHARSLRHNSPVSVLFCDVDRFKTINDTCGHAAGDDALREVTDRLKGHFRTEDTVGRLGGDEFAVICENSIGIASPLTDETSSQMLERADSTMYQAKAARNVV